jgi:hypothetical protein
MGEIPSAQTMNPTHITLALLMSLSGCSFVSTQAVYEEIRAQEKAKAVGTDAAPRKALPRHDLYEKERSQLAAQPR